MSGYDSDMPMPSVSDGVWRKARKSHQCCACELPINKGDAYRDESGLWDGEWSRYRYCTRCWHIAEAIMERGEPFVHGLECGHTWEDAFGEPAPSALAELAFWLPGDNDEAFRRRYGERG